MNAHDRLSRLRVEDPTAAAAAVEALWGQLAREEPKMFAALWRRANRPSRRPERHEVPVPAPVEWIEEEPTPSLNPMPSVNLLPPVVPAPAPFPAPVPIRVPAQPLALAPVMIEPSPSLADLLPEGERTSA